MSGDEKLPYRRQAIEDMLRYKADYDEYKKIERLTVSVEQMFQIVQASRFEHRPIKRFSGYQLFYQRFLESLGEERNRMTVQQQSRECSRAWKLLSKEEKELLRSHARLQPDSGKPLLLQQQPLPQQQQQQRQSDMKSN